MEDIVPGFAYGEMCRGKKREFAPIPCTTSDKFVKATSGRDISLPSAEGATQSIVALMQTALFDTDFRVGERL